MRNKNTLKQSLLLAALLPFLAFSVVLANHGAEEEEESTKEDHSVYENELKLEAKQQLRAESAQKAEANVQLRAEMKDKMTQRSDSDEERKAKRPAKVMMMRRLMGNQVTRSERAYERLSAILDKIETRRDKVAEKAGVNLTQADALIKKAQAQKVALKISLDKAVTAQAALKEESEDPAASVKAFMLSMKDLKTKIVEFHKTLHDAVQALKKAEPLPDKVQVETSVESTNN